MPYTPSAYERKPAKPQTVPADDTISIRWEPPHPTDIERDEGCWHVASRHTEVMLVPRDCEAPGCLRCVIPPPGLTCAAVDDVGCRVGVIVDVGVLDDASAPCLVVWREGDEDGRLVCLAQGVSAVVTLPKTTP